MILTFTEYAYFVVGSRQIMYYGWKTSVNEVQRTGLSFFVVLGFPSVLNSWILQMLFNCILSTVCPADVLG